MVQKMDAILRHKRVDQIYGLLYTWVEEIRDPAHFFPVFHRGRQLKSSRAGQKNIFFIFQHDFKVEISPKNATKYPVAYWHNHAKHSGLNSIFCCLKMNQF